MITLEQCIKTACDAVREKVGVGQVGDYIPALARIDPNKFGAAIAVWSPALNKQGNSNAGTAALEHIVHTMNWNMF